MITYDQIGIVAMGWSTARRAELAILKRPCLSPVLPSEMPRDDDFQAELSCLVYNHRYMRGKNTVCKAIPTEKRWRIDAGASGEVSPISISMDLEGLHDEIAKWQKLLGKASARLAAIESEWYGVSHHVKLRLRQRIARQRRRINAFLARGGR